MIKMLVRSVGEDSEAAAGKAQRKKKIQTPSSKIQRNPKLQIPERQRSKPNTDWILEVDVWSFPGSWILVFGSFFKAFLSTGAAPIRKQSKPKRRQTLTGCATV